MHSNDSTLVAEGLRSSNREGAPTNNLLAITPYPKPGLDINPRDHNDSIDFSSQSSYPSHLDFFHHPWYNPRYQVV